MNGSNTIPQATTSRFKDLREALYEVHPTGGALHIVTDDQNVDNDDIGFCRAELKKDADPKYEAISECNEMLDILEPLTLQERFWLVTIGWR